MNQAISVLGQLASQNQLIGGQVSNCLGGYYERIVERLVHSDVNIDKVENGFLVTIKGKRFVCLYAESIAQIIKDHL